MFNLDQIMHPIVSSQSNDPSQRQTISVVIVNFNGGRKILHCLDCLSRQTVDIDETIVIDNGSIDGSVAKLQNDFPYVTLIELNENKGLPAGRNMGLDRAKGKFVLFVDTDVYLEKDSLAQLLHAINAEQCAVVCPRIMLVPESDVVQCDGAAAHFLGTMSLQNANADISHLDSTRRQVDGCIGACFLARRQTVISAYGFNDGYFLYLEDHEFSLRMRSFGHRFFCEPSAVVHHERGLGTPGMAFRGKGRYPARRAFQTVLGRLMTIVIHYRIRTMMVLSPVLIAFEMASFVAALKGGWGKEWIRAWMWLLQNRKLLGQWRRRVQLARVVDDRDLLTGGPIPLAPGLLRLEWMKSVVAGISRTFNTYWNVASRWIG